MPEGHKVHHLAAQHTAAFGGQALAVTSPQGRFHAGARAVDGRELGSVTAVGKHLFYCFRDPGGATAVRGGDPDEPRVVHIHLGRYGKFTPLTSPVPEAVGSVRVRMTRCDGGAAPLPPIPGQKNVGPVTGFDLRGPTACETITPNDVRAIRDRLGPDPLALRTGDKATVRAAFAKSKKPAGALIMDQPVVSGVGNIFRAEIFYELKMDPTRPARDLSDEEFDALWQVTTRQMRTGLKYGKIVTRTAREAGRPREALNGRDRFRIYRQERCPTCGDETYKWDLGGRAMYACQRCQGI
ncbi:Fpg/Nei family DNA glycosylase [Alienimonas chondri]|uniref:DNA-(apurinic or apyrimidinic site) lyase n=1 Tax=Alienimonas chondri TaxID=2681879 RepID=A0ABX1VD13_9PLAN|nr:DNA glycosylase [Alienimonas chondri]NNJ25193.1 Endonuclease 8 1 [Alienimonas chondri]